MKTIIVLLTLLICLLSAEEREPLFVLIEHDPWAMVIGSDSPSFAIYSDSTVLYYQSYESIKNRKKGKGFKIYKTKVNGTLFNKIQSNILDSSKIIRLKRHYDLIEDKDRPTNIFKWFFNENRISISVYGDLPLLIIDSLKGDSNLRDIYAFIASFQPEEREEWNPEKIEVMLWSYEYAPQKNINWPEKWPDLKDSTTINRTHNKSESISTNDSSESYSVFLPYSEYDELIKFLKKKKQKGAIRINGKKMAVALRFPFPEEYKWME